LAKQQQLFKPTPISRAHATAPAWPQGFVWGVSTSSYQIEGAVHQGGRGPSIWDGRVVANGDTGDVACDHYHRFSDDIALMRDLGVSAYRFSTAWSRIMPHGRGAVNERGLAFYDRLIDALLAHDIEPWLCLYHWDLPRALAEVGGWTNRDSAGWFADYATIVSRRYGDRVKHFATINEPSVFTLFSYGFGNDPPATVDHIAHLRATHHVNLAHGAAVDVLRGGVNGALVGGIHNVQPCVPSTPADTDAASRFDAYWNRAFTHPQCLGCYPAALANEMESLAQPGDLARICRPTDWFGLNYYSPIFAKYDPHSPLGFGFGEAPAGLGRSGIGWPIVPDSFRDTLFHVHGRYRLPIYVTENGYGAAETPDAAGKVVDLNRVDYLRSHTDAVRDAIALGADVRGYFVWSLLDNFEWGSGYNSRFGLVYIDYPTQRRVPKASFAWYADLIRRARRTTPQGERHTRGPET
jgi:beta-glucosidase